MPISLFSSFFSSYILDTLDQSSQNGNRSFYIHGTTNDGKRKLDDRRNYKLCRHELLPKYATYFTRKPLRSLRSRTRARLHSAQARYSNAVFSPDRVYTSMYTVSGRTNNYLPTSVRAFRVRAHAIFARTSNGYGPAAVMSTGANPFASLDKLLTAETEFTSRSTIQENV